MQVDTLREFVAIARNLNFRKASLELHITQSALSKHIVALERELGFRLFDRHGSTSLTPAGEEFYASTQRMLIDLEDAIRKCTAIAGTSSPVRVQWSSMEGRLFGRLMPRLATPVRIVNSNTELSALASLEAKAADAVMLSDVEDIPGFVEELARNGYGFVCLGAEPFVILMSPENPLAEKDELVRQDLRGVELLYPSGNLFLHTARSFCAMMGDDLDIKVIQDPSLLLDVRYFTPAMLGNGIVIAWPDDATGELLDGSGIVMRSTIDGGPFINREYLVYRTDDSNPNVRALVQEVHALVGEATEARSGGRPRNGRPRKTSAPGQPIDEKASVDFANPI